MMTLLVAIGGAIGSVCRLWLSLGVQRSVNTLFPVGTFVVNIVGCFAFGVIVGLADESQAIGPRARLFLLTGVVGGFTTFSTFTFETMQLVRDAQMRPALMNGIGQLGIGLVAMWIGYTATAVLRRRRP